MECEKYKEFLWEYAEGGEIEEEVKEHIEGCEICQGEIEKIRKTLSVLNLLKDDFPVPLEIKKGVFERIEKRKKVKERVKKSSLIFVPAFMTLALILSIINIYKKENVKIIYPEEIQILTPEEVYFAFRIPGNIFFIAKVDTQDITGDLKFVEDIAFYDARNLEVDPGFHTLVIKVLNKKGEVLREIKRNFYLTDYKVAEIFPEYQGF